MRSLPVLRLSAAMCGATMLVTAAMQLANLPLQVPEQQLRLAWTLARLLIQL